MSGLIKFDEFSLDCDRFELLRSGRTVKLEKIPMELLILLATKDGHLVTRQEIIDCLWSGDVFVDTEHGINTAIRKIRLALKDNPDQPRFVQTVTGKGYRFVAELRHGNGARPPLQQETVLRAEEPRAPEDHSHIAPLLAPVKPSDSVPEVPKRPWIWASSLFLGAVVTLGVGLLLPSHRPRVLRYTQLTNDGRKKNGVLSTAITSDGSRVFFGEQNSQRLGTIAEVSVNGGTVSTLTILNDPNQLALDYSQSRSELLVSREIQSPLWSLSVPGGSALRRIGDFLVDGAALSPDGQSIAYGGVNAVYTAKADGSDSQRLITINGDAEFPRWSPDGKRIRFTLNAWDGTQLSLWEVSAYGSNLHPLFPDWKLRNDGNGSWTPNGRYFVFSSLLPNGDGTIMALRENKGLFDRGRPKSVALTSGPLSFSGAVPNADGKKILTGGFLDRGELMRFNLKRRSWEPILPGISAADLDFSRDGKWITYVSIPEGTLWRSRIDGSERLQLTNPPFRASMPRWSPDGKQIAFAGLTPNWKWLIYRVPADGGLVERLISDAGSYQDPNWSADGQQLVYGESSLVPKAVRILDLKSRHIAELPGSKGLFSPRWSPDGRYIIAITSGWVSSGQTDPAPQKIMRFDMGQQKWAEWLEASAVGYPAFSQDGKYLYFWSEDQRMYRAKPGGKRMEFVANIDTAGGMKRDDFGYWIGLSPDDSPIFLRDASSEEIYSLDVEFP